MGIGVAEVNFLDGIEESSRDDVMGQNQGRLNPESAVDPEIIDLLDKLADQVDKSINFKDVAFRHGADEGRICGRHIGFVAGLSTGLVLSACFIYFKETKWRR